MVGEAPRTVPDEVLAYARHITATLREVLGEDLAGACFVGSLALGGYLAGESDIDVVAVSRRAVPDQRKAAVADALAELTVSCPARGLELTLYRREVAAGSSAGADFEVNVNGGPRMARAVHLSSEAEPGFWYLLDRAIAHRVGLVITGPPAAELFADVPRERLLDAMVESIRWHRQHEPATLYTVLNASRAWRYATPCWR